MLSCPVCHRPGDGTAVECPTCGVAMVPMNGAASQYAVPGGGTGQQQYGAPPQQYGVPPHQYRNVTPPLGGQPPLAMPPFPGNGLADPIAPAWDRAAHPGLRGPAEPSTSPVVVITAVVVGVLLVAAVGWFTLAGDSSDDLSSTGPATTLTPVAAPAIPASGQTRPTGDGWVTYRTPDGDWLVDLAVVPSAPTPLPSNPTIQMSYGKTDFGRIGFGWSAGQVAPGTDETALLVDIMKGIALSRGATGIQPTVLPTDKGNVVTATLQLDSGPALFLLRSVDRRPLVTMVIADLGAPDPAIANRMLDSFRHV